MFLRKVKTFIRNLFSTERDNFQKTLIKGVKKVQFFSEFYTKVSFQGSNYSINVKCTDQKLAQSVAADIKLMIEPK